MQSKVDKEKEGFLSRKTCGTRTDSRLSRKACGKGMESLLGRKACGKVRMSVLRRMTRHDLNPRSQQVTVQQEQLVISKETWEKQNVKA